MPEKLNSVSNNILKPASPARQQDNDAVDNLMLLSMKRESSCHSAVIACLTLSLSIPWRSDTIKLRQVRTHPLSAKYIIVFGM